MGYPSKPSGEFQENIVNDNKKDSSMLQSAAIESVLVASSPSTINEATIWRCFNYQIRTTIIINTSKINSHINSKYLSARETFWIQAGFDNYHKIAVGDHIDVPKFRHM